MAQVRIIPIKRKPIDIASLVPALLDLAAYLNEQPKVDQPSEKQEVSHG